MANQRLRSVPCDLQVLHSHMKKEIESSRSTLTAYDLMRTRGMRRISICLIVVWSEDTPSSPSLHQWSFTCIRALLHTTATTTAQQKQRRVFRTGLQFRIGLQKHSSNDPLSLCSPVHLSSAVICLLLQVLHQFCILWFGDGLAKVWGESPGCTQHDMFYQWAYLSIYLLTSITGVPPAAGCSLTHIPLPLYVSKWIISL